MAGERMKHESDCKEARQSLGVCEKRRTFQPNGFSLCPTEPSLTRSRQNLLESGTSTHYDNFIMLLLFLSATSATKLSLHDLINLTSIRARVYRGREANLIVQRIHVDAGKGFWVVQYRYHHTLCMSG